MSGDSDYQQVFDERGHSYDEAMRFCPNAREQEFSMLFKGVETSTLKSVLDIPSGGGYLERYLPDSCQLHSIDPCAGFKPSAIDLEKLSLPDRYDAVVCLAALHHIHNKQSFIDSLISATVSGGNVLIADVAEGTGEAAFLDQFAGKHNQTGHKGEYLSLDSVTSYIQRNPTANLVAHEMRECFWCFRDEAEMLTFCRLLFGLVNVSDRSLLAALRDFVGVSFKNQALCLEWRLLYTQIQRLYP